MTQAVSATEPTIADGSPLHYSLLFAERPAREIFQATLTVVSELGRAARISAEPEIARTKIAWWRDEIDRLVEAEPRHPATRTLARLSQWSGSDRDFLEQIVAGAIGEIGLRHLETDEQLTLHCFRTDGCAIGLGVRKILGGETTANRELAGIWLGRGIRLTEIVRRFNRDLIDGRIYVPRTFFAMRGLEIPAGPVGRVDAKLGNALRELLDRSDECLTTARSQFAKSPHPKLVSHHIAIDLYAATNRLLRKRMSSMPPEQITLRQFGMLWRAWRSARAASRQTDEWSPRSDRDDNSH